MANKKFARVRYVEAVDGFALEVFNTETKEWDLNTTARCIQGVNMGCGTDYIHYNFLREVLKLIALGYEVKAAN